MTSFALNLSDLRRFESLPSTTVKTRLVELKTPYGRMVFPTQTRLSLVKGKSKYL